uniref:Uncharacterized protein n=1 Tax=Arundo donax TaxID=35708 RepID=A0A0A9UFA8_ARUDO
MRGVDHHASPYHLKNIDQILITVYLV